MNQCCSRHWGYGSEPNGPNLPSWSCLSNGGRQTRKEEKKVNMECWKLINAKGEKIKQERVVENVVEEGINTSYTVAREGLTEEVLLSEVLKQ